MAINVQILNLSMNLNGYSKPIVYSFDDFVLCILIYSLIIRKLILSKPAFLALNNSPIKIVPLTFLDSYFYIRFKFK
jgi:hypothetical protein